MAPINGPAPSTLDYRQLLARRFSDWRLEVDGLVARPSSFSLADLHGFPVSRQITHQACEEGWSFIAEWIGVPLSHVLNLVGVSPRARYVVFFAFDDLWESIDMGDAWHPQTLLAYGMNGGALPAPHGAPVRLRVPRQLGYKSLKYPGADHRGRFGEGHRTGIGFDLTGAWLFLVRGNLTSAGVAVPLARAPRADSMRELRSRT